MKRLFPVFFVFGILLVAMIALFGLDSRSFPQAIGTSHVGVTVTADDPCQHSNITKLSVPVTATGQMVAAVSGKSVYACHFSATFGGTSPTITFTQGTGTNCGTNTVNLTGAFAPAPNGTELELGFGGTLFTPLPGDAMCISLGGTTPTVAGVFTYVQQ
jgi:hypothetical protein